MADLTKLKRRSSLGAPPPPAEASPNLQAPEIAPPDPAPPAAAPASRETMAARRPAVARAAPAAAPAPGAAAVTEAGQGPHRYDGRSARRTGRTVQFATRVSPEFDDRVRAIAEEERILLVEVLERALDAYETARRSRS